MNNLLGFEDQLTFGKYKGKKIVAIMATDIGYLRWMQSVGYIFDEKVSKCLKCIKYEQS